MRQLSWDKVRKAESEDWKRKCRREWKGSRIREETGETQLIPVTTKKSEMSERAYFDIYLA